MAAEGAARVVSVSDAERDPDRSSRFRSMPGKRHEWDVLVAQDRQGARRGRKDSNARFFGDAAARTSRGQRALCGRCLYRNDQHRSALYRCAVCLSDAVAAGRRPVDADGTADQPGRRSARRGGGRCQSRQSAAGRGTVRPWRAHATARRGRNFPKSHSATRVPQVQACTEVSYEIPIGGTLGIMGKSGSGKTTITRLLQRLHSDYEG